MVQGAGDMTCDNFLENCDKLCLDEMFLEKQDLAKWNTVHDDFSCVEESIPDLSSGLVRGRTWRRGYPGSVNVLSLDVDWRTGVKFSHNGIEFILLNVYTPYECTQNEDEYLMRPIFSVVPLFRAALLLVSKSLGI